MYHHKLYFYICLIFGLILSTQVKSQLFSDHPCFAISNNGNSNVLFEYQVGIGTWDSIGVTGAYNINALAVDPLKEMIYACNGPLFGTVDPITGAFSSIGLVGLAHMGTYGQQLFDNIVGLTFDSQNNILYAVERMDASNVIQNDILFKIDPASGQYIPNSFTDIDGNLIDYVRIARVNDGTAEETVLNVQDIAMNPLTGEIFATHDQDSPAKITILDPNSGDLLQVLMDVNPADVGGLTFTNYGVLYGTTLRNTYYSSILDIYYDSFDGIVEIDYLDGTYNFFESVDPSNQNFNFQAIDCYTKAPGCFENLTLDNIALSKNLYRAMVDITVNNILESSTSLTFRAGSAVTIGNNFAVPNDVNLSIEIGACQ